MGVRNYLIEGVSGAGKTTVCDELLRRGHHAIHGDRELAYQGDPETGEPLGRVSAAASPDFVHEHHIWDVEKVKALVADKTNAITFFCGGSRNSAHFIRLFDKVFVLDLDIDTLNRRLAARPEDEFGGRPIERALIARLHATRVDIPKVAVSIDATAPLAAVVDEILAKCGAAGRRPTL